MEYHTVVYMESGQVQIERKSFAFMLKENPHGRFPRIIEEGGRNSANNMMIPFTGLGGFQKLLDEMFKTENELPTKELPP